MLKEDLIPQKFLLCGTARISFQQEHTNKEYLLWLWERLAVAGTDKVPEVKKRRSNVSGVMRTVYRFKTFTYRASHPKIKIGFILYSILNKNWIHSLFYLLFLLDSFFILSFIFIGFILFSIGQF